VLYISNLNRVSGEKGVSLTQIGEGDHCIAVNPVSERINLLVDMQHYYEIWTLTSETPEHS
jgi:hypothetical protein